MWTGLAPTHPQELLQLAELPSAGSFSLLPSEDCASEFWGAKCADLGDCSQLGSILI